MNTDYVNLLGAGAGFDTKSLIEALVEAERAPKRSSIDQKIDSSRLELSGISRALSEVSLLRDASLKLNDASDFNSFTVASSNTTAFTISASGTAREGTHSLSVSAIAAEKRMVSGSFASSTTMINGGNAFDLTIAIGSTDPTSHTVSVASATPDGVVSAINTADLGITAEAIKTGTTGSYVIQLTGETGSAKTFSITSPPSDLAFSQTQAAADASLVVDGVTFTRATNTFSDVISGATIALHSTTGSAASVSVANDNTKIKAELEAFVAAANSTLATFDELVDTAGGGDLAGNSMVRQIGRELKNMLINTSSTPGTSITRLSDLGVSITREGTLSIDDTKLDTALASNFAEVVQLFSADTNNQSDFGDAKRGIAGDLSKYLKDLASSTSYFSIRTTTINTNIAKYDSELEELETRLDKLTERYTKQFSAMQRIVNEMNTLGEGLTSTFENLPYNNRD